MKHKQILLLALGIVFGTVLVNIALIFTHLQPKDTSSIKHIQPVIHVSPTGANTLEVFGYKGHVGKDALTLLKSHATVAQNASGLVTTINGRKADDTKHEYWAFYVNGKMAQVGSAQYVTKDTDTILWKIDHY